MNKSISILILCGLLSACGGGGDEGGTSEPVAATPAPAPAPQPAPDPDPEPTPASSTNDLVAPDGFDYNPVSTQSIQVDISSYSTDRAFLSIYSKYHQMPDGEYMPVYDSRIVSVPLSSGQVDMDFSLVTDEGALLAEIWFYDSKEPLVQVFERGESVWYW